MRRILTWHYDNVKGDGSRIGPAYYIESEYAVRGIRVHAENPPVNCDAEFNVLDDGTTIFSDRSSSSTDNYGNITLGVAKTSAVLQQDENTEEWAGDFAVENIAEGSWVTCNLVRAGGGKNFTIQLELEQVSEDEEIET